jgi:hypothetical protein
VLGVRGTAVATALLLAALAAAGCGLGAGEEVGSVELTVTREFGSAPVVEAAVEATESDTVMRVLESEAEIATSYGGGFVKAIEGFEEDRRGGHPFDWFFFVDGVESPIGAADYELRGSERIWWDYRDWEATSRVPAVVGSWPAPFTDGYEGKRRPVAVVCMGGGGACAEVRAALEHEGVELAAGDPDGAIRVLVGPWTQVREDSAAALIEDGREESGVYADFERQAGGVGSAGGFRLVALGVDGLPKRELGADAGLVAATRRYEAPPVWVVTGVTPAGVQAAAELLDPKILRDHYAVAVDGRLISSLPYTVP